MPIESNLRASIATSISIKSYLDLPIMHRPASTAVFQIPELAENILLQLGTTDSWSWKQLFVVQRVNSTFQETIKQSPDLRRAMHLEQPDARRRKATKFAEALDLYRQFFFALDDILYPFWTHLRPISNPQTIVLGMNMSLFWSEEFPGVMSSRPPGTLDSSMPIERSETWRNLLVPYHPEHLIELHCCGYDVLTKFKADTTLGELADEAIRAGKAHIGGLGKIMYYGQDSAELGMALP